MITEDQRSKLSPDQLIVAERWDAEHTATLALIHRLQIASDANDETECNRIMDLMRDNCPDVCEHGHSIWDTCMACDDIEKVLYPGLFDENGDRVEMIEFDPFTIES